MTLTVYVPLEEVNLKMNQVVSGEGFVNVHTNYDTTIQPYTIRNCVYVISDGTKEISGCASVFVQGEAGTLLKRREHGSGDYASEDLTQLRSKNRSISTNTSLSALYAPTSFALPYNQSINFTTRWIEKSKSKNWITGASMSEEYLYASRIDRDGSRELDENGSTMTTETEFVGAGHIGVLKRSEPDQSNPKIPPVFESGEDYVGSFHVYERVDEYGKNVQSDRSVQGEGYVAVDRRIRDTQRTYESGTGSYDTEEMIRTHTNYIAKDINAVQGPGGYTYSPNFHSGSDLKWKEGMWSKSSNTTFRGGDLVFSMAPDGSYATYIGEEFSSADRLNKESIARGLNEMDTVASFSGRAAFRTVLLPSFNNSTEKIDIAEEYAGQYEIARKTLLTGVAKYDQPHISVIKEGRTILARYNGTSNAVLAEYRITVTNYGSRALGPIYVKDLFPPGTRFINASVRPTELASGYASWMLTHLAVGGRSTIELMLNVTEEAAGDLVNRVEVAGGYDGRWVTAANFSVIEAAWLSCCPPEISLEKAVEADPENPAIVSYTITVRNLASSAVAARITDYVPDGLTIIESSVVPSEYWQGRAVWTFSEIGAGEVKVIEYKARALRDGSYTNRVHIDASSVGGYGSTYADAAASVVVGGSGAKPYTTRYGGWQPPPKFGLNASEEGIQM
jgi:uncharacterized repeat protein (TIGR01451 family)